MAVEIFLKILPIILIIILGYLLMKKGFLKEEVSALLSRVVLYTTLPALIFTSFLSTTLSASSLAFPAITFLFCSVVLAAGFGIARLAGKVPAMFPASLATFEGGMFGYAFYSAIFGQENLWKLLLFDMGNGLFFFTVIYFLIRKNENRVSVGNTILSFLKAPIIIAIISGFLVSISGLSSIFTATPLSTIVETLKLLASATVPLIALSIGLSLKRPETVSLPIRLVVAKYFVCVVAGLAFMKLSMELLSLNIESAFPLLFLALLPISFSLTILMGSGNKDMQFIISSTMISIPVSVALIIISLALFGL